MASLAGSYVFESQQNYIEYLKSLGPPSAAAQKSIDADQNLEIYPAEEDTITVTFNNYIISFVLNEEVEYNLTREIKKKITATLNGNNLTLKTDLTDDGSLMEEKVFQPSDKGLLVNISNTKGDKAVRRYKRV